MMVDREVDTDEGTITVQVEACEHEVFDRVEKPVDDNTWIVSHREVIDQAKGMLMVIYQLSADAALPTP